MNRVEQILKINLDELSQDNGSYPAFKHADRNVVDYVMDAQEQTALEFTKWKDENYITYKIAGLSDGKYYDKSSDYWASKGKTIEQLFNEWNYLNTKQQTT